MVEPSPETLVGSLVVAEAKNELGNAPGRAYFERGQLLGVAGSASMTYATRSRRRSVTRIAGLTFVVASGLGVAAAVSAPDVALPAVTPAVRAAALFAELRRTTRAPSVSAAVACGGKIVFSRSAGFADLESATLATPETVYNIGSVSKLITAVAVMQLVEGGKVGLDDPIQKYVPSFPDKGAPITVWHLLTHTSGIRHYRIHDFPGVNWEENHHPYASLVEAIGTFKDDPLLFRPGRYYFYTSYGVNLLQGVVEAAGGMSFEEYLRQHVWHPAAMTSTALDVAGRQVAHRARGYRLKKGKLVPTSAVDVSYKYAGGGMLSTAEDLVRFGVAINQGKLLGPQARAQMFAPQLPVVHRFRADGPPATERFKQGLLWRLVHRPNGRTFVYECGTFNGFNTCLLDYTAEDMVVAMALNLEAGGLKPAEALADLFHAAP